MKLLGQLSGKQQQVAAGCLLFCHYWHARSTAGEASSSSST
jgi:hypothetical protein